MKELVALVFQALTLIAGLLWAGVCAAECRILPLSAQNPHQQQRHLPPCHKQHAPESPQNESAPPPVGCSTAYEDVAKPQVDPGNQDSAVVPGLVSISPSLSMNAAETAGFQLHSPSPAAPPASIAILRV